MSFLRPIGTGLHESVAADTNVVIAVPGRARIARLVTDIALRYTLGSTVASATIGFPLAAGTHDIDVADDVNLNLFETGGAGNVYVEFFGADVTPTPVRIKRDHQHIALGNNNVIELPAESAALTLAADTLESDTVPAGFTRAKLRAAGAIHYTTDGTDPSNTEGTDLAANTDVTLEVESGDTIKLFETGGATTATILYFGSKKRTTHVKLIADQAFLFTTDGSDPTADRGILVAANTVVNIPLRFAYSQGALPAGETNTFANREAQRTAYLKVRRASSSATNIQIQEFEGLHKGGDVYEQNVFRPIGGTYVELTADVHVVDVPKNANWAWIGALDAAVKYTTGAVTPTGTQRGFSIAANSHAKVPVSDGPNRLQLLRGATGAKATVLFFGL
ncbi:MAG: hypothetical protein OXH34_01790 [Bacteroidetes bacterium]|nr:hypothetical protein [Bacteroidota bacterium]